MQYVDVYTPDSVIAAALPLAGGESPREIAYNNAAYALDREDIHLIYSTEGGVVYYVAAASEDFAGHMSAVTPLAAALPGTKGHQGDGAYVAIAESGYAVVVKKESEMYSYVGDRQAVDAFISQNGVSTYSATEAAALPWEGYNLGTISRATKLARVAIVAGCVFSFFTFLAWFAIASLGSDVDKEAASLKRETEQSVQSAARQLNEFSTQPLIEDLRRMQSMIARATEYSGFVKVYRIREGGEVVWQIELPGWATSDIIERFGRGTVPEKDEERNVIVVTKGNLEEPTTRRRR